VGVKSVVQQQTEAEKAAEDAKALASAAQPNNLQAEELHELSSSSLAKK